MSVQFKKHLLISGVVQGVGYRQSLLRQAQTIGVLGWCRNTADGRVEAVVHGTREQVEALVDWCEQGPPHASVTGVEVMDDLSGEIHTAFEIRR